MKKSMCSMFVAPLFLMGAMFCLSLAPACAETRLPSELVDIENVMAVISKVNIRQVDAKTHQAVTDIMDEKSQMYQPRFGVVPQQKSLPKSRLATSSRRPATTQARSIHRKP